MQKNDASSLVLIMRCYQKFVAKINAAGDFVELKISSGVNYSFEGTQLGVYTVAFHGSHRLN